MFEMLQKDNLKKQTHVLSVSQSCDVLTDGSPRKMLAVSRPMSVELSTRSQRAVGRRKDTQRISMESLAVAQPHTANSSQWNKPKPESRMKCEQRQELSGLEAFGFVLQLLSPLHVITDRLCPELNIYLNVQCHLMSCITTLTSDLFGFKRL